MEKLFQAVWNNLELSKTGWNYPFNLVVYFYLITVIFKNIWKMDAAHFAVCSSIHCLLLLWCTLPFTLPSLQVSRTSVHFHICICIIYINIIFSSRVELLLFCSLQLGCQIIAFFASMAEKPWAGHFAIPASCRWVLTDAWCAVSHMASSLCSASFCSPENCKWRRTSCWHHGQTGTSFKGGTVMTRDLWLYLGLTLRYFPSSYPLSLDFCNMHMLLYVFFVGLLAFDYFFFVHLFLVSL